jgi:hypothetical protein
MHIERGEPVLIGMNRFLSAATMNFIVLPKARVRPRAARQKSCHGIAKTRALVEIINLDSDFQLSSKSSTITVFVLGFPCCLST